MVQNNNQTRDEKSLPPSDIPSGVAQALNERRKDKVIDDTDEFEEDEVSEEVLDLDKAAEESGMKSDEEGLQEVEQPRKQDPKE